MVLSPGLLIETVRAFPLFAGFIRVTKFEATGPDSLVKDYLLPYLAEGAAAGRFVNKPPEVLLGPLTSAAILCTLCEIGNPPAAIMCGGLWP